MADDPTLRISLEDEGQGTGGIPGDSSADALAEEWVRFRQQISRLQDALDPAAIGQRAEVALELAHAHDELNRAMERQKDELLEMMPHLRPLAFDIEKETRQFEEAMRRLTAEMDPTNVRLMALNELELMEARQKAARLFSEEMERLAPTVTPVITVRPLNDLEEETKRFELEMARLNDALDPAKVRERARMEVELAKAREKLDQATKGEKDKLDPQSAGGKLGDLAKALRGTIGGKMPLVGSVLDIMAAFGKGGGGAAGGATGALGAAAGPIAIAAAVFEALKGLKDGIGAAIKGIGQFTASLLDPSPDVAKSIDTMGGAISGVSDKLFYLSPVLGIFGKAVGETIGALGAVMKQLDGMVERFAAFNPQLAAGLAQADIRQTLGDMRRAQEAGPQLLRYLQQRTELQQKFEDMKIRILQQIMPTVSRLLEVVETLLPFGETALEPLFMMAEYLGMLAQVGNGILGNFERGRTNQRPPDFLLPTSDIARFREGPFFFGPEGGNNADFPAQRQ